MHRVAIIASNLARQCGCHAGDGPPWEAHQPQQERKLPDEAPPHRRNPPSDPGGVQRHQGRRGAAVRLWRPQQSVRLSSPLAQILTPASTAGDSLPACGINCFFAVRISKKCDRCCGPLTAF